MEVAVAVVVAVLAGEGEDEVFSFVHQFSISLIPFVL